MDFVSDALFDGRRLRALTVVDAYTREALAIEVDQGIRGEQVVETMARLMMVRCTAHPSGSIMGRSLSRRLSTAGPMRTVLPWTSRVRANPPTTPSWNPSTDGCAMNA